MADHWLLFLLGQLTGHWFFPPFKKVRLGSIASGERLLLEFSSILSLAEFVIGTMYGFPRTCCLVVDGVPFSRLDVFVEVEFTVVK